MDIKNKVDEYADLVQQIKERFNDNDAIVILQEIKKDLRMKEISKAGQNVLATEKQKKCLERLGKKYPASLTKAEASALIGQELK